MAKLLKESDLFVVQLQDTIHSTYVNDVVSVTFDTLKDSIVDLAVPGTAPGYSNGRAGVMYPGQGFYYDESDGRLDVRIDSDLTFVDVIVSDTVYGSGLTEFDTSYNTATGEPITKRGNFFIVGEPDLFLPEDIWYLTGTAARNPDLGDLVICVDDAADTVGGHANFQWNVIPNVTGGQAVLEVRATAPEPNSLSGIDILRNKDRYVDVHTEIPFATSQRPVVRVRKAGYIENVVNDSISGYYVGGLIDEFDKEKLDRFDLNLFEGGFVKSLNLRDEKVTTDSLQLDSVGNPLQPQYPSIILNAKPSGVDSYGVIEIASQMQVSEAIMGDSVTGKVDLVAMTPLKTLNNFVPRLFNSLPNLEIASQSLNP